MNIDKYLEEMTSIQSEFLKFIENDENDKESFYHLCLILEEKKKYEVTSTI